MAKNTWFEVDKEGLAKLLERRGKSFLVWEIYQNAWDQKITQVIGVLKMVPGRPLAQLTVSDDDPNGFMDLAHAYTLFAESIKKGDPTKRGRFNLGEKLVLACCEEAEIQTTTGSIKFLPDGSRKKGRNKTSTGSIFSALIRMTRAEYDEICSSMDDLIPPTGITSTFNGRLLKAPKPLKSFSVTLPTEIADSEGRLKPSARKTDVRIYRTPAGRQAYLYEMGIPVVETEDTFRVDIQQKVPLNMDRDNVTPAYLRKVRVEVLNHSYDLIKEDEANTTWVRDALSDKNCSDEAIDRSLDLRFGTKRVAFDPSDQEANKRAMDQGYTVIPGKSLSAAEWDNAKRAGAVQSAGKVFPTGLRTVPNGVPAISWDKLSDNQKILVLFTKRVALHLMGKPIEVEVFNLNEKAAAWYGGSRLAYNVRRLGKRFFDRFPDNMAEVLDLILHELAHDRVGDHYSEAYHKECTRLGGLMTVLALRQPELFETTDIEAEIMATV